MNRIEFQSLHFKASRNLEDFVYEKVSKLFDQEVSIIKAEVTLYEGSSGNPGNKYCQIQLFVPGDHHVTKKNSDNYEKSVLSAVETLQKVLRRQKSNKIRNRRQE